MKSERGIPPHLSVIGYVSRIQEENNPLYLLCYSHKSKTCTVQVYSMDGQTGIRTWEHEETCSSVNKLAFCKHTVLIPSRSQNKIVCYTLTGSPVGKDINITLFNTDISLCVTTSDPVIIVQGSPSLATSMDRENGSHLWKVTNPHFPSSAGSDAKSRQLLVFIGKHCNKIQVQVLRADIRYIHVQLFTRTSSCCCRLQLVFLSLQERS